jgi:glycosyltransferase involved in cell wall biosynthesis
VPRTIAISINASWNIVNFRKGLVEALLRRGHRVVALAPEDEYSASLLEWGAEFVPLAMDQQGVSPIQDLRLLARYHGALRRTGAELLLGYTIKPNIYGSLAAHACAIPVINNISGLGTAFLQEGMLTRVATFLYKVALRRSHTVFFQNSEDRDLFVGRHIVRPDQVRLLPGSGIDLSRFVPDEIVKPEDGALTVLFAGRLLWDKGLREFIEAARLVRTSRPDARFQILGFLGTQNRSAVGAEDVRAWVAEGLVEYLGAADDVRPHFRAADCIVLPSYREGLPRVLLEGAALGKPLIATDVPGCRDVIEEGVNGFLCAVRNPASLAQAMLNMLALPEERRREMGAAGRRLVEERFDERLVIDAYLQAIDEALALRSGR